MPGFDGTNLCDSSHLLGSYLNLRPYALFSLCCEGRQTANTVTLTV